MKYKWLNRKENKKLIVFFNGWGMDEAVVAHLDPDDYDILMFYDYNNLETDFDFSSLKNYEKHLVSWSMGVMIATLFPVEYISSTAINGTLKPIDSEFGINPRIYDLTIRGFNEQGRERFIRSMFDSPVDIKLSRDIENQKSELVAIKSYSANLDFKYTRVLISDNDKIIPTRSQEKFWNIPANLTSGHCPFFLFKKWSEGVNG